jgi:hypothetical protein
VGSVGYVAFAEPTPQFEPHTWNEDRRQNLDGTSTSQFHVKHVNYMKENREWESIDLTVVQTSTGFVMNKAPYAVELPAFANGPMKFTANNRYHPGERKIIKEAPISKTRRFTDARRVRGTVTDEGVLYKNALPDIGAHILLQPHEEQMRYLIKWDRAPRCSGNLFVRFEHDFNGRSIKKNNGVSVRRSDESLKGFYVKEGKYRGIGTLPARIWDSDVKNESINIQGRRIGNRLRGRKVVPCDFFKDAVFPVYTDDVDTFYPAAGANSPVDGRITFDDNAAKAWATVHDDDGSDARVSSSDTETTITVRCDQNNAGNTSFNLERGIITFDTSSIPDENVISAVTLDLYGVLIHDNQSDKVGIVQSTPASTSAIVDGDYDAFTVDSDTAAASIALSSLSTSAYNTFTFDSAYFSWIDQTGVTKLGARMGLDYEETSSHSNAPGSSLNLFRFSTADETGTSQDPLLTVTHAEGAAATTPGVIIFQ